MQSRNRVLSFGVSIAVTAALAAAPAILQPATAAVGSDAPARAAVTAQCAAAQVGVATAKKRKAKAHKKVVKARKALRKAKKTHRPARIKKAKRVLTKARHRQALRKRALNTANMRMAYACSSPTSAARAYGTGQQAALLVIGSGSPLDALDLTQLTALVDRLLPGASGVLSPGQLTSLLGGVNAAPLGLDGATALLGDRFSPAELQSLLGGTADPAVLFALAGQLAGQLSAMTGGAVPVTGSPDLTSLLDLFAGMAGTLDPTQLGGLVDLLLSIAEQKDVTLDSTQLGTLLDGLIPNITDKVDASQLTSMLTAVNGASLDPATLSDLLGGQFSSADLGLLQGGAGTDALKGEVLGNIVAQLGTLGGGDLTLPGTVDPAVLTGLVSSVTDLVSHVVGGVPIVGDAVCTLLPILC
jgi:hypothetical protein